MAALHAGIPVETSINTINRQCSSGLTAVNQIANQIRAGQIDIGIGEYPLSSLPVSLIYLTFLSLGAGVESMTHGFGSRAAPEVSDEVLENKDAEDCLLPMGITSENVAADYHIPRSYQDAFSAKSFQKAAAANKAGKFKDEIVPILAKWIDPKTEEVKEVLVNEDDGIRDGVTAESLAKIKPAFKKDGVTHAGTFPAHLQQFFCLPFLPPSN